MYVCIYKHTTSTYVLVMYVRRYACTYVYIYARMCTHICVDDAPKGGEADFLLSLLLLPVTVFDLNNFISRNTMISPYPGSAK